MAGIGGRSEGNPETDPNTLCLRRLKLVAYGLAGYYVCNILSGWVVNVHIHVSVC